jgi:hypothetical protein
LGQCVDLIIGEQLQLIIPVTVGIVDAPVVWYILCG